MTLDETTERAMGLCEELSDARLSPNYNGAALAQAQELVEVLQTQKDILEETQTA
jgi:hypothetical protein